MKNYDKFINNNLFDKTELNQHQDILFNQYKLYVEMADNVSKRRENSNKFYLTINSALFPSFIYLVNNNIIYYVIIYVILNLICTWWIIQINEYKKLNEGKFKVITKLEEYLPIMGFKMEWEEIKPDYVGLTNVEKYIPWFFKFFYLIFFISTFYNKFHTNLLELIIGFMIPICIDFIIYCKSHSRNKKIINLNKH